MSKREDQGVVREMVPESERMSYKSHGVWVRHKKFNHVGRIAYYDRKLKLVAVVWEPTGKGVTDYPEKNYSSSLVPKEVIAKIRGYDPMPWYDFEEIARRKKRLDGR